MANIPSCMLYIYVDILAFLSVLKTIKKLRFWPFKFYIVKFNILPTYEGCLLVKHKSKLSDKHNITVREHCMLADI